VDQFERLLEGVGRYRRVLAAGLVAVALTALSVVGYTSGGTASAAYYYYSGGGPVVLTLSPAAATNTVGTSHTVTAAVMQDTSGLEGVPVFFSVTGAVTTSGQCTTDNLGQCTFTYTGPSLPGSDLISAYADTNDNGVRDPDEPTAIAAKAWIAPPSTTGSATGSGEITVGGRRVSFDFSAKSDGGVKGSCTVNDLGTKRKIRCTDATVLVVSGNQASIFGQATDNGVTTTYRIDVVDNAEPGVGSDTFSIQTASGFSASGTLTSGNIQVHQ
jgi:hypothetical protein